MAKKAGKYSQGKVWVVRMVVRRLIGRLRRTDEIRKLQQQLSEQRATIKRLRKNSGVEESEAKAPRLVWIFGCARTGSTWLAGMLSDIGENALWDEPLVGRLFGNLYYLGKQRRGKRFILGDPESLRDELIRNFVIGAAQAKFPQILQGGALIVKEPNGSVGAPLLSAALPESRMIFLVRDPRDIRASIKDATAEGGFRHERMERLREENRIGPPNPDHMAGKEGLEYVVNLRQGRDAYYSHEGPKVLVKYEDLRTDPLGEMRRIVSAVGLPVGDDELVGIVHRHSWEHLPSDEKGEGKRRRKASPGGWRDDLTDEQISQVESEAGDLMDEFGYDRVASP